MCTGGSVSFTDDFTGLFCLLQSLLCCVMIPVSWGSCCFVFTKDYEFLSLYCCLIWEIINFYLCSYFSSLPSFFFFLFFWNDHDRNSRSFVGVLAIPQIPKALLLCCFFLFTKVFSFLLELGSCSVLSLSFTILSSALPTFLLNPCIVCNFS